MWTKTWLSGTDIKEIWHLPYKVTQQKNGILSLSLVNDHLTITCYIYIYSTNLIKSFVESYSFDALGKLPFIFMLASSTWGATYTCKCSKLPFNNLTMHSQLSVPTTAYRRKDILISWSLWMKCLCTLGRKLMASSSWNVLFLYVAIGYFDI